METTFCLIASKPGKEENVAVALENNNYGIEYFEPVFGEYDFVLKITGENNNEVAKKIMDIRKNNSILHTESLVTYKFS